MAFIVSFNCLKCHARRPLAVGTLCTASLSHPAAVVPDPNKDVGEDESYWEQRWEPTTAYIHAEDEVRIF